MEQIVLEGLRVHPFVLPTALALWALAAAGWAWVRARRRRAGRPAPSVWGLVFCCALGLLLAVTLTPSRVGLGLDVDVHWPKWCHPRIPRVWFGLLARNDERRWNVLVAVPLGLAAAAWCRHRPRHAVPWLALVAAFAVPVAVEVVQAEASWLGRVCAVVDVLDNVTGVLLGVLAGALGATVVAGLSAVRPRR